MISALFRKFMREIKSGLGADEMNKIMHVGGTSKPDIIGKCTKCNLETKIEEDEMMETHDQVVKGAATQCGLLERAYPGISFGSCAGCTIGIASAEDKYKVLVKQNAELPCLHEYGPFSNYDTTKMVDIAMMEGGNIHASLNRQLKKSTFHHEVHQIAGITESSTKVSVYKLRNVEALECKNHSTF